MTTQEIHRLRSSAPFEPFRILTADGKSYDVRHPENFAIAGNGRLIAVGMPDHFVTLDLLLVTGIARPIPQRKNGKSPH
jgi:hypothetical protein